MGAVRRVAIAGFAASLVLATPVAVAGAAGFVYTAQSRSVSAAISRQFNDCVDPKFACPGPPSIENDSASAPGYASFWETARVSSFPQSFATQSSSLSFNSIDAQGTLEATSAWDYVGPYPPHVWLMTSSSLSSSFSTSFSVAEATPYRLTGHIVPIGVWRAAPTTTRITLKTAGGSVIVEGAVACIGSNPDPYYCDGNPGPVELSSVGILQPGSYLLEAISTGSAGPFYAAGNIFEPSVSGGWYVTLEASELVTVPSLSPLGLACLAAVLILVSWPGLSKALFRKA